MLRAREQIEREVRELGWWYQYFELPEGVWTGDGKPPAYKPETRWNLFAPWVPQDLSGKTVLDVGGSSGYFSVQMMKRGAAHCVLVEPFREFASQARYVRDLYNFDIDVVEEDVHTYVLTREERFDYVLFLGLFYHLKYPVLVLDRLAEMTRERLYFQSHILGQEASEFLGREDYKRDSDDGVITEPSFPRLAFIERLYNGDPTNWWIPNPSALDSLLRSAGLRIVAKPHPQVLVADPEDVPGKVVFDKLVFPRYGKPGGSRHPGPQRVDADLWAALVSGEIGDRAK